MRGGAFSWSQLRDIQVKDVSDFEKASLNFNNDNRPDGTYKSNDITYIKKTIIREGPGNSNHYIYLSISQTYSVLIYTDGGMMYKTYVQLGDKNYHITETFPIPDKSIIKPNSLINPQYSNFHTGGHKTLSKPKSRPKPKSNPKPKSIPKPKPKPKPKN
jgi:hypothetical protein